MNALLAFLQIVLPQAPQLAGLFRSAFTKVGGDPADFDAILAANQADIDKLAHPDSFRHKPGAGEPPPPPPPPATGIYGVRNAYNGRDSALFTDEGLRSYGAIKGDQLSKIFDGHWSWIVRPAGYEFPPNEASLSTIETFVRTIA